MIDKQASLMLTSESFLQVNYLLFMPSILKKLTSTFHIQWKFGVTLKSNGFALFCPLIFRK